MGIEIKAGTEDGAAVGCSAVLADTLRQMIELIEAHEVTCFSCDQDGELYCDCLQRMVKDAKAKLSANDGTQRPGASNAPTANRSAPPGSLE